MATGPDIPPLPACLRIVPQGSSLSVRVQPRASRTEVVGLVGADLKIRVAAPPVDDAANQALLRFLAEALDCSRASVQLTKGSSSRSKVILILGLAPSEVCRRLGLDKRALTGD